MTKRLKELRVRGDIEIVHFPYDPDSSLPNAALGSPSAARINDLHLRIGELPGKIRDYTGTPFFKDILAILGHQNRRDALHVDSAVKSGCVALFTVDRDILDHAQALGALMPLHILHPDRDIAAFEQLLVIKP